MWLDWSRSIFMNMNTRMTMRIRTSMTMRIRTSMTMRTDTSIRTIMKTRNMFRTGWHGHPVIYSTSGPWSMKVRTARMF